MHRRKFLRTSINTAALFVAANSSIYLVGSKFKQLDGSLVAGAKTWTMTNSGGSGTYGCSGGASCPPTAGTCTIPSSTKIVTKCGCDGGEWMSAAYTCN